MAFPSHRRIHRKVIGDDDPKRRQRRERLSLPSPSPLFPKPPIVIPRCTVSPATRDRSAESGTVPVVHAPITICLHEILGFFFRHGRREKISPRGFMYRTVSTRARKRENEREERERKIGTGVFYTPRGEVKRGWRKREGDERNKTRAERDREKEMYVEAERGRRSAWGRTTEATKGRKGEEREEKGPRGSPRGETLFPEVAAQRGASRGNTRNQKCTFAYHGETEEARRRRRRSIDRTPVVARSGSERKTRDRQTGSARAANTTRFGRWSAHVATFTCSVDRALSASIYDSLYRAIPLVICP